MQSTQQQALHLWSDLCRTPAAVLRHTAQYLARYGWTNTGFYDWTNPVAMFPPACVAGAIRCAVFGYPVQSLAIEILDPDHDIHARLITTAQVALADEVDPEWHTTDDGCVGGWSCALEVISDWNDEDGRTVAEVIAACYAAADTWDAAHPLPVSAVAE